MPPHRDGVTPHRGQPDPGLLHAAPRPGGTAWPPQHAGGCQAGPVSQLGRAPCLLSLPAVPDRPEPLRTTTSTARGVPRTTLRPSGSRWIPGGPPSSRASSPRAETPASSTCARLPGALWGWAAPGTVLSPSCSGPCGGSSRAPTPLLGHGQSVPRVQISTHGHVRARQLLLTPRLSTPHLLALKFWGPKRRPRQPEGLALGWGGQPRPDHPLLPSDDFVTSFFVGFSNDSQTWVMYTNGYEEMVGTRALGSTPLLRATGGLLTRAGGCSEARLFPDLPWERGQGHARAERAPGAGGGALHPHLPPNLERQPMHAPGDAGVPRVL